MWRNMSWNIPVVCITKIDHLYRWFSRIFQVQKRFPIWRISYRCVGVHYSTCLIWFFHAFSSQLWLSWAFVCHPTVVRRWGTSFIRINDACLCFPGEKVSIGVTTLLSMTVFLMLVTDSMPPNSESLPLIGKTEGLSNLFLSECL